MRQAFADLLDRLLAGSSISMEEVLWIALAACLLFASVHLLTMLLTRWGDRKANAKSLICSILVHLCLLLGFLAFAPESPLSANSTTVQPDTDVNTQIREVKVESEEQTRNQETGNTPVWEKPPEQVEIQLSRLERDPFQLQPLDTPERTPEAVTEPEIFLPSLPISPEQPVAVPKPESMAAVGPKMEVTELLKIDDPSAEARRDLVVPSPLTSRTTVLRTQQTDTPVQREASRGTVDRKLPELDPAKQIAMIDATPSPSATLRSGPIQPNVEQRTGPAPSAIPVEEAGTTPEVASGGEAGSPSSIPQVTPTRTRTPRSTETGTTERFSPGRVARTPTPEPGPALAVRDSVPVEIPRVGPAPSVLRPNFDSLPADRTANLPATYRLRSLARRKEIARKFGGTDASERAVEASLKWLAANQTTSGYWDADAHGAGLVKLDENGVDRREAGKYADTGLTALAILAFLGAGYTHEEGPYAEQIDRAIRWLVGQQREDGYLGGPSGHYAAMYCHAMSTYAIAEAYGMQSDATVDTRLREPIERAVAYTLDNQNPKDGGWRYVKGQISDMSMFGWQLMALKSAEIAGVPVPQDAKDKMVLFLKERSLGKNQGLAGYRIDMPPTPSMTSEALFCKQMLGIQRDNPACLEAIAYLKQNLPRRNELNLYYWYYGTLAMFQYGGPEWRTWNESVRSILEADQIQTGENAGSWDPKDPWGPYGGRVYSTAVSTLCLEVYYRFLPLYQMGGQYGQE